MALLQCGRLAVRAQASLTRWCSALAYSTLPESWSGATQPVEQVGGRGACWLEGAWGSMPRV
jgi:hypothetical protein